MNHSHWEHGGWNLDLCCGLRRLGFPARLGLGCPCSLFLGRDYRYFFPSPQEMQACWPWQMFSQRIHPPLCVSWTSGTCGQGRDKGWSCREIDQGLVVFRVSNSSHPYQFQLHQARWASGVRQAAGALGPWSLWSPAPFPELAGPRCSHSQGSHPAAPGHLPCG